MLWLEASGHRFAEWAAIQTVTMLALLRSATVDVVDFLLAERLAIVALGQLVVLDGRWPVRLQSCVEQSIAARCSKHKPNTNTIFDTLT